jgi:two-component system, cell cycle sensor histidine kinase and response regulator CckA
MKIDADYPTGLALFVVPDESSGPNATVSRGDGLANALRDRGFEVRTVVEGAPAVALPADVTLVVVAPGVDTAAALLSEAREAGVPVLAEFGRSTSSVEEHIRELESRLVSARRLEVVGRLVGGVAHDFNNILSVVSTLSELLIRFGPDEDPNREDLEEILAASRRGSDLTRQLQAFARADIGDPEAVDLGARLKGAEKLVRKLLPEDIAVALQEGERVPEAWLDPVEVDQVVFNLVAHGRWLLRGGGSMRLATETGPSGRPTLVLDLAPRPGLPVSGGLSDAPEGDEAGPGAAEHGAGGIPLIGLVPIEEIAVRRSGRVVVTEHPAGGCRIEVELDRAEDRAGGASPNASAGAGEVAGEGRPILVVEDDDSVREAVVRVLRALEFDVEGVAAGGEALARLRRSPPAVVVCDVVLRDAWGSELRDAARAEGIEVPFLFVSGHEEHPAVASIRREGDALVRKPVTAAALGTALARLLESA